MELKIALAGNPNCGKTTLFNALTGSNQFVGNWPGVTVEKKEGKLKNNDNVTVTDLPGIYSLSPYTMEEVVARNYLVGERPDAILNLVDGTNIERNLYLTTQLMELGIPVVIAINMIDVVRKNGDMIDTQKLGRKLGCRIVEISALKGIGIFEAAQAAIEAAKGEKVSPLHIFSGCVEHAVAHIEEAAVHDMPEEEQRWYAIKIFERDQRVIEQLGLSDKTVAHIEEDIKKAEAEMDDDAESIITNDRYDYVAKVLDGCYVKKNAGKLSVSDKIDRVITNRWLGLPIFALIMFLVYYISMSVVGTLLSGEALFSRLSETVGSALEGAGCALWLKNLVTDGIIAGVGGVLGFVPQLFVLFIMLAFLEACGYMSRIAFVLDRIFRKFGLSGKSFIPILIGTGCGVPGIMASRTIENPADRRMTVLTTTFIPCGAKTPLISMIAGAVFGGSPLIAASAYFMGMAAIVCSGVMLKKTRLFASDPSPFVMELPAYHMPTLRNIMKEAWDRTWSFIKKAGTVILIFTVFIWFATHFGFTEKGFCMLESDRLDRSFLAMAGSTIAWIFAPLGWGNWQPAVATLTGLVAKENIVSTMSVLCGAGGSVYSQISGMFTGVSAFSFMTFNLLCAPCVAAINAIRREMNSAKWFWFAILYQCGFAYLVSLAINQVGNALSGNGNIPGIISACAVIVIMIYMILRKPSSPKKETA